MIDIIDMDDIDTTDSGEQQQQVPPPVVPQPQYVDPRVVANEISRNILAGLGRGSNVNESAVNRASAEMLAQGVPPQAIQSILKLNLAMQEEREAQAQLERRDGAYKAAARSFFEQAEDIYDRYEAKLAKDFPGISYAKDGLIQAYRNKLQSDPAFANEWRKFDETGTRPSSTAASKCMALVVEDFITKMGLKKTDKPINLSTSKTSSGATTGGDLSKLDARQLKQYNVFKRTKGNEFDAGAFERALRSR